ncbi:MAG TPA: hypothetical protein ENI98_10590 [Gammaproteobacteria bacterium]|nr:hypothetical protein [Gammaproteobacteria bacterium]
MKTTNPGILKHLFWLWILSALLLSACGNRFEDQLRENYKIVQTNLEYLKNQLDTKQLSNALLIEKYANALIRQKPDYSNIANLMKKEATSQGKAYTALSKRLAAVNLSPTNTEQASASLQELQLINSAADVFEFNNSLADVVNTLASLSDGQLPLINVPSSQKASAQQANALIGNPSYGSWRQDNSGRSFWEWYGMYSLFNNVFGRHTYYDSWSSRPHYSYYNNYGRSRWGSSADINRNHNLSRRYPSRYNKPSAAARTRYATGSSRSSSYGGSYNKSSSSRYSSYGSSSRSSSFTSSRGFRGGK